jgi:hypothetical protein
MRYLVLLLALAGCPEEQPPACTTVDLTCHEGYVATFDNVYKNTLHTGTCGDDNNSCHTNAAHNGGLSFEADEPTVYASLMAASGLDPSRQRVVPGNPGCSLLTVRTEGVGKDYQMPKGDPLDAPTQCALVKWIAAGAMNGSAQ